MPEQFNFSKIEDQKKFDALPPEEKDRVVADAEEEAHETETRWKNEYDEAKKEIAKMEKEFSPEIIEKIMEKVQDINKDGLAFSIIKTDKFEKILSDGLLGSYENPPDFQSTEIDKNEWVKIVHKDKNALVYFNITGRMSDLTTRQQFELPILYSGWVASPRNKDNIIFLFDIKSFVEEPPIFDRHKENQKFHNRTFRGIIRHPNIRRGYDAHVNKSIDNIKHIDYYNEEYKSIVNKISPLINDFDDKKFNVDSDYGFALSHRVAPKFFNGIVMKFIPKESKKNEYLVDEGFILRAKEYISKMIKQCQKSPECLLPIYDVRGNLYWPKQMTYEEVKKFVEERDEKKE